MNELNTLTLDGVSYKITDTAALPIRGGTMEGSIAMGGNRITGLSAPGSATEPLTQDFMNRSMGLIAFANNTTFDIPFSSRGVVLFSLQLNGGSGYCLYVVNAYGTELKNVTRLCGEYTPRMEAVEVGDGNCALRITCNVSWSYGWYITRPPHRDF